PDPNVNINPAGPFCEDDAAVVLTGTPPGGTWGGTGVGPGGQFDPMSAGAGIHNVTYTFTHAQGCTGMADIDIEVNPAPMVSVTPPGDFCEDAPAVVISASPPGGVWTGPVGPNGEFDPASAGPGNHSITYTFTNAFGCEDMETINVQVFGLPNVVIDPAGPFCENDPPVNLNGSPPGGTWSGDVDPGGGIDPSVLGPGN